MTDGRIKLVDETGSTNADLRAQASHWPEGMWLRSNSQSAGQGRLGRRWQGGSGNLYTSTLIRLRPDDPLVTGLSFMAGVAVHTALSRLVSDVPFMLKWPNDIMVEGAKLAGILLEREGDAVIVGIGVNVTSSPALPDRPTVALTDFEGGAGITAAMLLDTLVATFDHWLAMWRADGLPAIIAPWLESAHPLGTALRVSLGNGDVEQGQFGGLDQSGALILQRGDGTRLLVHSGDVGILA